MRNRYICHLAYARTGMGIRITVDKHAFIWYNYIEKLLIHTWE